MASGGVGETGNDFCLMWSSGEVHISVLPSVRSIRNMITT